MLKNIIHLYENSILSTTPPEFPDEQYYIFFDKSQTEWVWIPKVNVSDKELNLLKTLYELIELPIRSEFGLTRIWYDFLFLNGQPPIHRFDTYFRFIQFYINGDGGDKNEIESALKGFFSEEVIIVWENNHCGIVIEEEKQISLSEKELISMSDTLESDLYVKISFYIGRLFPFSNQLNRSFQEEKEYFQFGKTHLDNTNIFTFERVFPAHLAKMLPIELTEKLNDVLSGAFNDEPEMFLTIKAFLENNLNASVTAKKLYIHRNTLQYRIDKFVEKTGIQLKDFYGAFTIFLACLLYEQGNMPKK